MQKWKVGGLAGKLHNMPLNVYPNVTTTNGAGADLTRHVMANAANKPTAKRTVLQLQWSSLAVFSSSNHAGLQLP